MHENRFKSEKSGNVFDFKGVNYTGYIVEIAE